mmetsp:Transcript_17244/g.36029  ORF Transcript_17244/g.36029 Transcript_17244/m.36029 type:complete len:211 (-) Transcript_17244:261-893(-)
MRDLLLGLVTKILNYLWHRKESAQEDPPLLLSWQLLYTYFQVCPYALASRVWQYRGASDTYRYFAFSVWFPAPPPALQQSNMTPVGVGQQAPSVRFAAAQAGKALHCALGGALPAQQSSMLPSAVGQHAPVLRPSIWQARNAEQAVAPLLQQSSLEPSAQHVPVVSPMATHPGYAEQAVGPPSQHSSIWPSGPSPGQQAPLVRPSATHLG